MVAPPAVAALPVVLRPAAALAVAIPVSPMIRPMIRPVIRGLVGALPRPFAARSLATLPFPTTALAATAAMSVLAGRSR